MEFNGKKASLVFKIIAVESIPCELRGEIVAFDAEGNMISDPIQVPWRTMNWVSEEIQKRGNGSVEMPDKNKFKIYNPEEPDQYVFVEVQRF